MKDFKGITHILLSVASYFALQRFSLVSRPFILPTFICLFIGALIADIDTPKSMMGRFFVIGEILFNGHRNVTHTLPAAVLISIPVFILYDPFYGAVFLGSYLLHLLADSMTMTGIKWLYPLKNDFYSLKLMRTGDVYEYLIILFCIQYILLG